MQVGARVNIKRGNVHHHPYTLGRVCDSYQTQEKTCENALNLENAPEAVADFHLRFPHKPGP